MSQNHINLHQQSRWPRCNPRKSCHRYTLRYPPGSFRTPLVPLINGFKPIISDYAELKRLENNGNLDSRVTTNERNLNSFSVLSRPDIFSFLVSSIQYKTLRLIIIALDLFRQTLLVEVIRGLKPRTHRVSSSFKGTFPGKVGVLLPNN